MKGVARGSLWILIVFAVVVNGSAILRAADSTDEDLQLAVVMEALSLTGIPYRWGGSSLGGMDCSGLVYLIYSPLDPGLPRRSVDQYRYGLPVETGREEPGDLLFFNTDGWTASHVGIYLGEGRFIHAASGERANGIIISRLSAPYYRLRYLGARRLETEN